MLAGALSINQGLTTIGLSLVLWVFTVPAYFWLTKRLALRYIIWRHGAPPQRVPMSQLPAFVQWLAYWWRAIFSLAPFGWVAILMGLPLSLLVGVYIAQWLAVQFVG